jgi:UDP-N-acetylglucosamine acyltransferase
MSRIHPSAIIYPNVTFEDISTVEIGAYCVVGSPPEDKKFFNQPTNYGVYIGKNVRISDLITIHSGTVHDTEIKENTCVFAHTHIAHDCIINENCIIGGGVSLAGHSYIMPGANISGRSATVPFAVVGAFSFVGNFSLITKHVACGVRAVGYPAKTIGINEVGLERSKITYDQCVKLYSDIFDQYAKERPL